MIALGGVWLHRQLPSLIKKRCSWQSMHQTSRAAPSFPTWRQHVPAEAKATVGEICIYPLCSLNEGLGYFVPSTLLRYLSSSEITFTKDQIKPNHRESRKERERKDKLTSEIPGISRSLSKLWVNWVLAFKKLLDLSLIFSTWFTTSYMPCGPSHHTERRVQHLESDALAASYPKI